MGDKSLSTIPELAKLQKIIDSPPDKNHEYTRIKKDIFHAFHMLPIPVNHGARSAFLRALRDHMLRFTEMEVYTWDKQGGRRSLW